MSENRMTGDGPAIEARGLVKVYGETRRPVSHLADAARDLMNNSGGAGDAVAESSLRQCH